MDNALYELDRDLTDAQLIDSLEEIPERLRQLLAGQSDTALLRHPGTDEWSAIETVRHICDAVQVYGMRFKWMILQDEPFLANYEEGSWVAGSPDGVAELESMLSELRAYRNETIRLLRALPAEGWLRSGRHEISGPVELRAYVRHQLAHEEQHLEQLQASLRAD